ncbi:hypothetical protein [Paracoccus sp. (in: a-proteobacteria)]|uniref:hypothetical protein n=1 Tax=Paracoccus sp. TaxID=267 RepID=UPI003A882A2C
MADNVTNELILEHLKAIQAKLSEMSGDLHDLKTDLRGVKGHMASFMQSEVAQDGAIAALQERLDRIERRLELRE